MPGFWYVLGNRTINFRMFECLVTCFLIVTASLLCRLQAVWKTHFPIYPCLIISEGRRNCSTFISEQQRNRDCQETLPNINKCENWCWYFSENLRIVALTLLELTKFASPNLSIYFNFVWCWGSVVMLTFWNYPPMRSPLIVKVYVLYFVNMATVAKGRGDLRTCTAQPVQELEFWDFENIFFNSLTTYNFN